jgi:hypothetical protein
MENTLKWANDTESVPFKIDAPFIMTGDQPAAVDKIAKY